MKMEGLKYTISLEADKKIQEDVDVINKIILNKYGDEIKAIVMFGGFGHMGGSFREVDNKILPLNDYDLYIISENEMNDETLEKLGEECSKALGRGGKEIVENYNEKYDENEFFHVDLHNLTEKRLKKLYPTQRTFDLKSSIVVYGNENILENIPDVKISKSDAIRLLFNKLDHFAIAENNSEIIKSIYAVKGFTDLCTSILIYKNRYVSRYQDRVDIIQKMGIPDELKELIKIATKSKLYEGYKLDNADYFFEKSKEWVKWTLKKILRDYLKIESEDWKIICKECYEKLPYIYFNDYLKSNKLFFGQYYLNWRFFISGLRKDEFLIKNIIRWRDSGLIVALSLILYSVEEYQESEKYLKKLTNNTKPLKDRILKLYSVYYLQKLL